MPEDALEIVTSRIGSCQLAQHEPSTVRILISVVRNHHQCTFDNGPDDAVGDDCWRALFIGRLDQKWQISDKQVLHHRFSWVSLLNRFCEKPRSDPSVQL